MVGSMARSWSRAWPNVGRSTSCTPGRVDGRPTDLAGLQLVGVEVGGVLGDSWEQRSEAVEAEEDPGSVVNEAGRDGVVVDGRLHGRESVVADRHRLTGIDEVHAVHRQGAGRQAHDADAEKRRD